MPLFVPDKVNMNYANMIEEKNLKKTFIIATLVSTLVGTFAASHNLYDRLTQKKKDENQDGAIKKLEEKIDQMSKTKEITAGKKDDLKDEFDRSGQLIKREFDGAYDRLGRRYAIGDILTENELQRQIILLQQTVIGVLEDALYSGRQLDRAGVDKLMWATKVARNGSLDALQGQYQRLTQEVAVPRNPPKAIEAQVIESRTREASPRRATAKALPPPPLEEHHHRAVHDVAVPRTTPKLSETQVVKRNARRASPRRPSIVATPPLVNEHHQRTVREIKVARLLEKIPEPQVIELSSRGSSPRRSTVEAVPLPTMVKSTRAPSHPPSPPKRKSGRDFYCGYSVDLQLSPRPLSKAFSPNMGSKCPTCNLNLDVDSADMWEFKLPSNIPKDPAKSQTKEKIVKEKENDKDRGRSTTRKETVQLVVKEEKQMMRIRIPAKFVVKCHTAEGDYACVLCCGPLGKWSGAVVLCDDPEALVDHIARDHKTHDIEKEIDIIVG